MTSPRKRNANRANARKSTGPKSKPGKTRSSLNSVKHSLTRPIDALPWGEYLGTLTRLLEQDGLSPTDASDLAKKILDHERNVDYQRARFLDFRDDKPLQYETPDSVHVNLALARQLERTKEAKTAPISDEKLDGQIARFFRSLTERDLKKARDESARVLRNADRHLRRSANRLLKSLRSD